jgi:hypothetical protein
MFLMVLAKLKIISCRRFDNEFIMTDEVHSIYIALLNKKDYSTNLLVSRMEVGYNHIGDMSMEKSIILCYIFLCCTLVLRSVCHPCLVLSSISLTN